MKVATRTLPRKAARTRRPWLRWLKLFVAFFLIFFLASTIVVMGSWLYVTNSVKDEVGQLEDKLAVIDTKPSQIVSADGKVLYEVTAQYRKPFKLSDVPPMVRNAFIEAEDRRFYSHNGVDPVGLLRAGAELVKDRHASQGGSTLTMQLAKQLVTDTKGNDRSFDRKLKDIALASEMEKIKSKDQILELYLKTCYFGEGAFGLASASDVYFGKEIKDLTLSEAAMLARCVRRPGVENPAKDYKKAIQNRDVVLGIMKVDGIITASEYEKAKRARPKVIDRKYETTAKKNAAQYFVDYVKKRIETELPDIDLKSGGYRVETTLRLDIQKYAEKAVNGVVHDFRRARVTAGCFVLVNSRGEILAMVGGTDYGKSQFNVVTDGMRQPGSSFKPIVYATGLATGKLAPDQTMSNAPIEYPDPSSKTGYWRPQNASRRENAPSYPMSTAIALSVNRPAIHALEDIGIDVVRQSARDVFGIQTPIPHNLTIALGTGEVHPIDMAEAYSVFMLKGDRIKPESITRVIGPDGQLVKEFIPTRIQSVLDYEVCEHMDGYLREVVTRGTATIANSLDDAHGKTGTTSSHKDAWFCGYANGLIGVAWVGNLSGKEMTSEVYGGTVSARFWTDIMTKARDMGLGRKLDIAAPKVFGADEVVPSDQKEDHPEPRHPRVKEEPTDQPPVDATPVEQPKAAPVPEKPKSDALPPSENFPSTVPPLDATPTDPKKSDVPPIDEPKPAKPKRDRPSRDSGKKSDTVTVEVCADTGELASIYCPETVTRTFPRGKAPRRRCHVHSGGG
ncbi:PBP1A family penicillin-binding protein [soil metagenome]